MKQTIIMIHGFRGTHHGLSLIKKELSGHYQIIIPDLPGFGDSKPLKSYSIDSYVDWLKCYIIEQDLPNKPILLGHSFGSIICAAYAASNGSTISDLILVNPISVPALDGPNKLTSKLALYYYLSAKLMPKRLARIWLSLSVVTLIMSITMSKTDNKQLRKYIHSQHLKYFSRFHSVDSVVEVFLTSISSSVEDFAIKIKSPTLLIVGAKDDITKIEDQYKINRMIKKSKLVVIDNAGHLTHYETPDQVADSIREFIKS